MTINIIEELAKISNNSGYVENVIEHLEQQQEETKKQLYLLRVINIVQKFEEMIKDKTLEKLDICTADLSIGVEEDIGNIIKLSPYDNDGLYIDDCYYHKDDGLVYIPEVIEINNLFSTLNGLNRQNVSEGLKANKVYNMKIEQGCSKIIMDALLSKELKSLYNYSQLDNELNNQQDAIVKKPKL